MVRISQLCNMELVSSSEVEISPSPYCNMDFESASRVQISPSCNMELESSSKVDFRLLHENTSSSTLSLCFFAIAVASAAFSMK